MKINKILIVAMACLLSVPAFSQLKEFHFRKKLDAVQTEGWYSVPLSSDVFANVQPGLSDLRIYNFADKDTAEAPYLLRVRAESTADQIVELPMLNKSKKDGKLFVTFELPKNQKVNYLDLAFDEDNFNGHVQLEGSADQKEWFSVDSLQRILSVKKDGIDFKATTLTFPTVNYHFLRAAFQADKPLTLVSASFKDREITQGVYIASTIKFNQINSKQNRNTVIDLTASQVQPVSDITVVTKNTTDFYRPITIEVVTDSTQTPKGWVFSYDVVYNGYITSLDDNTFKFSYVFARKFKITIHNADNAALKITDVKASGPEIDMVTQLSAGDNYLYYGNAGLSAPSYDAVHFEDKIPSAPIAIGAGQSENIYHQELKGTPLFQNKVWLYAIMGFVMLILGYFTLKMINTKK